MPGTDSGAGGLAEVLSVSCYSAGNCVAGGFYDGMFLPPGQAFLASERNGRWGKAIEVPGTAKLNTGKAAEISSVSCSRTGACTAGGYYTQSFPTNPYLAIQASSSAGPDRREVRERAGAFGIAVASIGERQPRRRAR